MPYPPRISPVVVLNSSEDALTSAADLSRRFAATAAQRDRHRVLPHEQIDELSSSGLLAVTVPSELGGPGGGVALAAEILRLLAVADPNIAQIPQSHFLYLSAVLRNGDSAQRDFFAREVRAGRRIANAQAEPGGEIRTRLHRSPAGLVLDGAKQYATGALFAHWIGVLALDEQDRQVIAFVRRDSSGLRVVDDWMGMGQRTSASGTVRIDTVIVDEQFVVPHHLTFERPTTYGAFAQLLHAAIDVGIARGALREAGEIVRSRSQANEDPLLVQQFGELEISVRAAEALLAEAGRAVDAAGPEPSAEEAAAASIAVAAAKVLGGRIAVEAGDGLFELGGASATHTTLNLDRYWRNARTHTLHDPARSKVQHVGRYAFDGTLPPRNGTI